MNPRPVVRVVALVAAVWLLAAVAWFVPDTWLDGRPPQLQSRADAIEIALDRLHAEAIKIAAAALNSFPPPLDASPANEILLQRLEGIGIVDADGAYLIWQGSPADPPGDFNETRGATSWIEKHGSVSRWIVRAGPDAEGWLSLASFTLRSQEHDGGLQALLPQPLFAGVDVVLRPGAEDDPGTVAEGTLVRTWQAEGRSSPVRLHLRSAPAGHRAGRVRGLLVAFAVLLTTLAVAFGLGWRSRVQTNAGIIQAVGAILALRLLISWTSAPQWLLAREASSASLFGVRDFGRLLASPADLLLTGLAFYLVAVALRRRLSTPAAQAGASARWVLIATSVGGAVLVGWLVLIVARNSRETLFDTGGDWTTDARLLVAAGLILALLGVASLVSRLLLRRTATDPSTLGALLPTTLCFSVLALATAFALQQRQEDAQLERMRVDLAPQVLEQSARRRLALQATIAEVQRAFADPSAAALSLDPAEWAFRYWIDSALAHGGYQSSLDFYDLNLQPLSHFGYDIPELDEDVGPWEELPADSAEIFVEPFRPVPSVRQQLLHVEAPLTRHGEPRGVVVAHVLDEPENLPFLPASRAYLAALGQHRDDPAGDIHYVVYDAQGTPLSSTLTSPPAETGEFRLAALSHKTVKFRAGDKRLIGIALGERDRLHLLLVEDAAFLERLAGALRFLLTGLAILFVVALLPRLLRRGGLTLIDSALRGSFQRKLVAAMLVASVVPLIGLSLILRGYIETHAGHELDSSAVSFAGAAQKLLEDATAPLELPGERAEDAAASAPVEISDSFLLWLRRVVGQDVHVYERGRVVASSKRELFDAGVLPARLDGWVHRQVAIEGRPSLVSHQLLAGRELPVAYAPIRSVDPARQMIVAVPMVRAPGVIQREVRRVAEIILVATVLLAALLIVAATYLARTVARPLRSLAEATAQIAAGDYDTRLRAETRDEVADLVRGFNAMARSLKQQRTTLERRRDYIETLLQHATMGVLSIDSAGAIVTLNPTATELLSAAGAAVEVGADLAVAVESVDALAGLRAALRDGAAATGEPVEFDLENDTGPRRLRMVRVPLPGSAGRSVGTLILLDDVTELTRSNQLAAWAEMARAIAHEIKNPLTPIQLSAEHLRKLLTDRGVLPDDKIEACIETVIKQVRTLYEIAGDFSTYAKLPVLKPEPHDPAEFMRETMSPYRSSMPAGIELVETYDEVPKVAIDYRVLSRAVVNLIENAIQAMPDGGRLNINVSAPNGGFVEIGVDDNGVGLDPEVKRRLFEPYFSTKSSGTGLGLAIALRAIEAHQGTIEVDSAPGKGTRFRIRLPALRS